MTRVSTRLMRRILNSLRSIHDGFMMMVSLTTFLEPYEVSLRRRSLQLQRIDRQVERRYHVPQRCKRHPRLMARPDLCLLGATEADDRRYKKL